MASEFTGKKILVLGAAISGISVARILRGEGAAVTLSDAKTADKLKHDITGLAAAGALGQDALVDEFVATMNHAAEQAVPAATEVLIVGATRDAADDLARRVTAARGATFGLHRASLTQLAARLAAAEMARLGVAPATSLGSEAVAARVRESVRQRALTLREKGVVPGLAVVLVGDDPASAIYVRSKAKMARECAVDAFDHKLAKDARGEAARAPGVAVARA
jgi:5,10-methylene-tetrahydrofolate dehydrogenase/methenyl tetrahydrofolate cyclohydrolase